MRRTERPTSGASTEPIDTSDRGAATDHRRAREQILEPLSVLSRVRESCVALAALVRDLVGMLDFLDLLNLAGKSLLRVPVRGLTLFLLVSFGLKHFAQSDVVTTDTVTRFSFGYAAIFVVGGILLLFTVVVLRGSRLTQAQALHLNLTEVRKRTEYGHLARALWRKVYATEAIVLLDPDERRARELAVHLVMKRLHEDPFRGSEPVPGGERGGEQIDRREFDAFRAIREQGLYFTRRGFLFVASRLLQYPIPPHLYRWFSGLDFARVADYLDGGYFDVTDDRLAYQFAASPALARARRLARLPELVKLRYGVGAGIRRLWFLLVSRSFAIQVSRQVARLERQAALEFGHDPLDADGRFFNALHLLWSTSESDGEVERVLGTDGLTQLAAARRQLVTNVFGRKPESARRAIDRMFGPNWMYTHEVRKRADPEYVRRLDRRRLHELAFLKLTRTRLIAEQKDVAARAIALERFEDLAARFAPERFLADGEAMRAIESAFLMDDRPLRAAAAALADGDPIGAPADRAAFEEHCERVVRQKASVTLSLRELRIHHLLCREQIVNYRRQVAELMGAG